MSSPSAKRRYLAELAAAHGITLDDVHTIIYGEKRFADQDLQRQVQDAIIGDLDETFICLVWSGETFPGTVSNLYVYDYVGQVVEGLNLFLHKTPYHAQIFPCNAKFADYAYYEHLVTRRPGCGVVVIVAESAAALAQVCRDHDRPLVFTTYPTRMAIDEYHAITLDETAITAEIVAYLVRLGHSRIAYIHGVLAHEPAMARLNGYYAGLAAAGLTRDERLVGGGNWRESGGYAAAQTLLAQQPRPTAIIAGNDRMALGVIQAVRDAGLCVPQNVSVVGYDDLAISLAADPPLTTVRLPLTQIGMKAAEMIVALLEGGNPQPRHQPLPLELIIRKSTGTPPGV